MSNQLLSRCTCSIQQATKRLHSLSLLSTRAASSSSSSNDSSSFAPRSSSTSRGPEHRNRRPPRQQHRPPPTQQEIAAENLRRDQLARDRFVRQSALSPEKLYALKRERERVYSANPDSVIHSKTRTEKERLARSARNVRAESVLPRFGGERREGGRDRDSRGGGGGRNNLAQGSQQQQMMPGRINQGTWTQGPRRDEVKAVVRGGAPRNANGGGVRRRKVQRELKKVTLPSTIRLENLTNLLGVKLFRLQQAIERTGLGNSRPERLLTAEDASLLALEFDFDPTIDDDAAFDIYPASVDETALLPRPPVTGIFGHVDHGKTSLLDALRSTTVAAGEAGGITQHIGAFEVPVAAMIANLRAKQNGTKAAANTSTDGATITFLDTPGHAAFTAMRERGAGVTDVVVLVVAADDGVKPQTEEVINLLKSSASDELSVVVALTKCDKPGIDTLKVKQSLMAAGVEIEDFGGEVPCVEVSSVTGKGLPELLETISALAEVRDLKAEREGRAEGRVLESRVVKGKGNVATVLVHRGSLRTTASLIAGQTWAKVRTLTPASGAAIQVAYPGQPVEVTGWKELPTAGDLVLEGANEDEIKRAVSNRLARVQRDKLWADVERLNEQRALESAQEAVRRQSEADAKARGLKGGAVILAGDRAVENMSADAGASSEVKELVLMIKADGSGTVEAVVGALQGIGNAEARVKIVSSAVGDVQEGDVDMARAIGATIVGFNVKAPNAVLKAASRPPNPIKIHTSPIIYRLVDQVRAATADLLPKTIETRVHGEALVQMIFEIGVKGRKTPKKVAGCKVNNGVFQKARKARVVRNGETIFTGSVDTLKQVKKDVSEISKGTECGIALEEWELLEVDDVIQSIEEVEVARTL